MMLTYVMQVDNPPTRKDEVEQAPPSIFFRTPDWALRQSIDFVLNIKKGGKNAFPNSPKESENSKRPGSYIPGQDAGLVKVSLSCL